MREPSCNNRGAVRAPHRTNCARIPESDDGTASDVDEGGSHPGGWGVRAGGRRRDRNLRAADLGGVGAGFRRTEADSGGRAKGKTDEQRQWLEERIEFLERRLAALDRAASDGKAAVTRAP